MLGAVNNDPRRQQLPPSGWYPDPAGTGQERYWDGSQWSTQTRPLPPAMSRLPTIGSRPDSAWEMPTPTQDAPDQGLMDEGTRPGPAMWHSQDVIGKAPNQQIASPAHPSAAAVSQTASTQPPHPSAAAEIPRSGPQQTTMPHQWAASSQVTEPSLSSIETETISYLSPAGQRPRSTGPIYAHWGWRSLGAIIDGLILSLVAYWPLSYFVPTFLSKTARWLEAVSLVTEAEAPFPMPWDYEGLLSSLGMTCLIAWLVFLIYHMIFLSWLAASPGKLLLRLRVVPEGELNAHRLRPSAAGWRQVAHLLASLIPIFGIVNLFAPLWRRKRQTYHDSWAKTVVLKVK